MPQGFIGKRQSNGYRLQGWVLCQCNAMRRVGDRAEIIGVVERDVLPVEGIPDFLRGDEVSGEGLSEGFFAVNIAEFSLPANIFGMGHGRNPRAVRFLVALDTKVIGCHRICVLLQW